MLFHKKHLALLFCLSNPSLAQTEAATLDLSFHVQKRTIALDFSANASDAMVWSRFHSDQALLQHIVNKARVLGYVVAEQGHPPLDLQSYKILLEKKNLLPERQLIPRHQFPAVWRSLESIASQLKRADYNASELQESNLATLPAYTMANGEKPFEKIWLTHLDRILVCFAGTALGEGVPEFFKEKLQGLFCDSDNIGNAPKMRLHLQRESLGELQGDGSWQPHIRSILSLAEPFCPSLIVASSHQQARVLQELKRVGWIPMTANKLDASGYCHATFFERIFPLIMARATDYLDNLMEDDVGNMAAKAFARHFYTFNGQTTIPEASEDDLEEIKLAITDFLAPMQSACDPVYCANPSQVVALGEGTLEEAGHAFVSLPLFEDAFHEELRALASVEKSRVLKRYGQAITARCSASMELSEVCVQASLAHIIYYRLSMDSDEGVVVAYYQEEENHDPAGGVDGY